MNPPTTQEQQQKQAAEQQEATLAAAGVPHVKAQMREMDAREEAGEQEWAADQAQMLQDQPQQTAAVEEARYQNAVNAGKMATMPHGPTATAPENTAYDTVMESLGLTVSNTSVQTTDLISAATTTDDTDQIDQMLTNAEKDPALMDEVYNTVDQMAAPTASTADQITAANFVHKMDEHHLAEAEKEADAGGCGVGTSCHDEEVSRIYQEEVMHGPKHNSSGGEAHRDYLDGLMHADMGQIQANVPSTAQPTPTDPSAQREVIYEQAHTMATSTKQAMDMMHHEEEARHDQEEYAGSMHEMPDGRFAMGNAGQSATGESFSKMPMQ